MKEIEAFRAGIEDQVNEMYLGISAGNMDQDLSEADNPFSFSDGTAAFGTDMLIKWDQAAGYHTESVKCAFIQPNGKIINSVCTNDFYALCSVPALCSGSDRSRANLLVLALFAAGSVFKAFYALVGPDF